MGWQEGGGGTPAVGTVWQAWESEAYLTGEEPFLEQKYVQKVAEYDMGKVRRNT